MPGEFNKKAILLEFTHKKMNKMVDVEDLFKIEDPYHKKPEKFQELKFEVIKKAAIHHYNDCQAYKRICRKSNFNPTKDLKSYQDIVKIPWITSKSFKQSYNLYQDLISVPENQIYEWYHSSGTSGDPSFVGRDELTYNRFYAGGIRMMELLLGVKRFQKGIVFGPPLEAVQGLTFAIGMKIWTEGMCDESIYLMTQKREEGKIPIDIDLTIKTLVSASKTKEICNVGGASPLAFFTLKNIYENSGQTFDLNKESFGAGFGGGWKTVTGEQITREQFRQVLSEVLGIYQESIRDIYALTENDMIYMECEEFSYHVPPWGEVIIRDPETMAPVEEGEKGLINLINPLAYSWPGISILLDDVATLVSDKKCKCGRFGRTIDQIGRAVGSDARGCGAMVTELAED